MARVVISDLFNHLFQTSNYQYRRVIDTQFIRKTLEIDIHFTNLSYIVRCAQVAEKMTQLSKIGARLRFHRLITL